LKVSNTLELFKMFVKKILMQFVICWIRESFILIYHLNAGLGSRFVKNPQFFKHLWRLWRQKILFIARTWKSFWKTI